MKPSEALQNLADALVDDILALSDDEIMAEALEDLGSQEAVNAEVEKIRQIAERAIKAHFQEPNQ